MCPSGLMCFLTCTRTKSFSKLNKTITMASRRAVVASWFAAALAFQRQLQAQVSSTLPCTQTPFSSGLQHFVQFLGDVIRISFGLVPNQLLH